MNLALIAVDKACADVDTLLRLLKKSSSRQIQSVDERARMRLVATLWFKTHKSNLTGVRTTLVPAADKGFAGNMTFADVAPSRTKVITWNKALLKLLSQLRVEILTAPAAADTATPDFSPIASDPKMRDILTQRWQEILRCKAAEAHLGTMVMMGGLLEGLFLAKVLQTTDKAKKDSIFRATSAPKDSAGKVRELREWTLSDYITVFNQIGLIPQSVTDISIVIRDYRNFIHPVKEYSTGAVRFTAVDSEVAWAVFAVMTRQIITC